jgi:FdhD protein
MRPGLMRHRRCWRKYCISAFPAAPARPDRRLWAWLAFVLAWEGAWRTIQWRSWVFPAPSHVLDATLSMVGVSSHFQEPLRAGWRVPASSIAALPEQLRARQTVFDETGGLHAAGLFHRDGGLIDVAEDVGRHNAVDKIVGRMLMRDALPLSDAILCVSGRTSYEIIQKALFAGIPIVAAVSAPSTMAVDLAEAFGITLAGFVRGEGCNLYARAERVV